MLIPLVVVLAGCRLATEGLVSRSDRRTPRDAATGIAVGGEERDLGPTDSPGAVLFVHGFVGGSNNFADLPDRLAAKGWRVRALRLPGHGTSPRDFARRSADELIDHVKGELRALKEKHDRVVVVGHSMGGALSSLAVSDLGAESLVLGAPYFGVSYKWFYVLPVETWHALLGPALGWVYKGKIFLMVARKEAKKDIYSYDWIPSAGTTTLIEIGRRANDPATLAKVSCPVLFLHAPGDDAASFDRARAAVERIGSPEKETVELPRSNHHIFFDYDRELVFESVERFVGSPEGAASETVAP